ARLDAASFEERWRLLHDLRPIEQDAARAGVRRQDRRQQIAGSAADVDDRLEGGEVVRGGDRRRLRAVEADHRRVEVRRVGGMLTEVLEDSDAERFVEAGLAGLKRVEDLLPAAPEKIPAKRQHGLACRAGRAGLERFAKRRQREALTVALGEQAKARQR